LFVGHYGPSFAIKSGRRDIPLWVLFVAVQFLDFGWSVLVLLGVEKVRIVPGITASNPLDLYYMPYTHSLAAAILWAGAAIVVWRMLGGARDWSAAVWIGIAVFSHWLLDFLVHRPDLPLYGDTAKVGLGVWNYPAVALSLDTLVSRCCRGHRSRHLCRVCRGRSWTRSAARSRPRPRSTMTA
jgi:hypothetical protein